MKKTVLSMIVASVASCFCISCDKSISQESTITDSQERHLLYATFVNDDVKTSRDDTGHTVWNKGDEIWLSDGSTVLSGEVISGEGTKNATIAYTGKLGSPIYAVYPYSAADGISGGNVQIIIPSTQSGKFEDANICVAKSTGDGKLPFKNATAILKVESKLPSVTKFTFNGTGISGKYNITPATGETAGSVSTSDQITVTPGTSKAPWYIAAAAGITAGTNIAVYTAGSKEYTKAGGSRVLARNKIYNLGYAGPEFPSDVVPGIFTVAEGKTVCFSKGNLYVKRSSSSSTDWNAYFYENQYDYDHTKKNWGNVSNNDTEKGWFLWSAKNGATNTATDPSKTFNNFPTSDAQFVDYGKALLGDDTAWYTLSGDEWNYLGNTRSGNRWSKATVCGVAGLLLFPDGWTEYEVAFKVSGTNRINNAGVDFSKPIFNDTTEPTWKQLENTGVVFLPAAGYKTGGMAQYSGIGSYARYWSTNTANNANNAYFVSIATGDALFKNTVQKDTGLSIRLVKDF